MRLTCLSGRRTDRPRSIHVDVRGEQGHQLPPNDGPVAHLPTQQTAGTRLSPRSPPGLSQGHRRLDRAPRRARQAATCRLQGRHDAGMHQGDVGSSGGASGCEEWQVDGQGGGVEGYDGGVVDDFCVAAKPLSDRSGLRGCPGDARATKRAWHRVDTSFKFAIETPSSTTISPSWLTRDRQP